MKFNFFIRLVLDAYDMISYINHGQIGNKLWKKNNNQWATIITICRNSWIYITLKKRKINSWNQMDKLIIKQLKFDHFKNGKNFFFCEKFRSQIFTPREWMNECMNVIDSLYLNNWQDIMLTIRQDIIIIIMSKFISK